MWFGPGESMDWSRKWQPIDSDINSMRATFQCYRDYWHVNMVRIFVVCDWWWRDTVVPSQYERFAPSTAISYRTYIETLVQEAGKYGLYIDFCPYTLVNAYALSDDMAKGITVSNWQGEPGGRMSGTESALFLRNVGMLL